MKMMINDTGKTMMSNTTADTNQISESTTLSKIPVSIMPGSYDPSSGKTYDPRSLTVSSGTTVIWTNNDESIHTVTEGSPDNVEDTSLFDSGILAIGKTFEFKFSDAGSYGYYCTLHPWMTGSIKVI